MTLSQLDEPLRSKIVHMTADVTYWYVTYQSDATSTAAYFSSYEAAASFRGIVEHSVHDSNDTIAWSEGRLPNFLRGNIRYVLVSSALNSSHCAHTAVVMCVTSAHIAGGWLVLIHLLIA
jgi:hypothetical protein